MLPEDSVDPGRHPCTTIAKLGCAWLPCPAGIRRDCGPHGRRRRLRPAAIDGTLTESAMHLFRLLPLAVLAICLAATPGRAQFGKPFWLRDPAPTIEDAAPGQEPAPEAKVVPEIYRRQPVFYRSDEAPGTIIIDTSERFLYLIQPNNVALRYGIGVGRDGFQWNGLLKITRKAEWPDWTPPAEMIERQPYLPRFMAGGPGNPMGARALYLGNTVYRIHGTNAPDTIGHAVSSGCFRLVNEQITDLYERVPVGTKVIVQQ
jgi:lipoprotein-anchoring transpeptidase ErfK/SrfK